MQPCYVDPATGATYPLDQPRWRSDTGGPLMISDLPGIGRSEIRRDVRSLWRYAAALPLAIADPVSLGEGLTPLVERTGAGTRHISSSSGSRHPAASRTAAPAL